MKPRVVIGYSGSENPAWETIIAHASEIHCAVLNWGDGPGEAFNPANLLLCNRLRAAGIKIFGYLYSGTNLDLRAQGRPNVYSSRPHSELQPEIDRWNQWYGVPITSGGPPIIDGFFVDECANEITKLDYDRQLIARFSPHHGVFLNFGVVPHQGFTALRAAFCISEHAVDKFMEESYPPWVAAMSSATFLVIVYNMIPSDVARVTARLEASHIWFRCLSAARAPEPEFGVETELFGGPSPAPIAPKVVGQVENDLAQMITLLLEIAAITGYPVSDTPGVNTLKDLPAWVAKVIKAKV